MRLLFIKPKHIGDSLVLTPTIAGAKAAYPDAEIWVIVRKGCEGILAGCPQIDRILCTAPVDPKRRADWGWRENLAMLRELRSVRFEHVFELGDGHRARWFAMASRRRRAYSVKPAMPLNWLRRCGFAGISTFEWNDRHRVEKDYLSVHEFLPLAAEIPAMIFARERTSRWAAAADFTNFAVLQVGTRQKWNRWHREGWLEAARHLLAGAVERLVLTCGPDPKELAETAWLQEKLGAAVVSTEGRAGWAELADLFYRARLYLGPNTAAMHLAAACGCPTVALFGPTRETHWRPWRAPSRIVTSDAVTGGADTDALVTRRTMKGIAIPDVLSACDSLLGEAAATPRT